MILDEIYENILWFRDVGEKNRETECPFANPMMHNCNWCELLFPEIIGTFHPASYDTPNCPCLVLSDGFVKSEMRRLFP